MKYLLIQSGAPKFLWAEAADTECVIRNLCPTRAIEDNILQAVWRGVEIGPADYSMLRVFGCQAWISKERKEGQV